MRRPVIRVNRTGTIGRPTEFYINLVGGNGEIMLTSEMYPTKQNANRAARNLRRFIILARLELAE